MLGLVENGYLPQDTASKLGQAVTKRELLHGDCEALASLVNWTEVNAYLGSQILDVSGHNPFVRVVREGKDLPLSAFWVQPPPYLSASSQPQLNERALHDVLRNGASVAINQMHRSFERVAQFAKTLMQDLGSPVQVNGYASFRPTNAFRTHWDGHDVIAVQVYGAKRWKVYRPTEAFPMLAQPGSKTPFDEAQAELVWDGTLQAGEFLYVPRGWWHAVKTEDTYSMHLTVGLRPVAGINFLHWLVDQMMDDATLRQDLPLTQLTDHAPGILQDLQQRISRRLTPDALDAFAHAVMAHGQPKSRPSLPFISAQEFDPACDYELTWRNHKALQVVPDEKQLRLTDGAYIWRFNAAIRQPLETLLSCQSVWMRRVAPVGSKVETLCQTLVSEGLMEVTGTKAIAMAAAE